MKDRKKEKYMTNTVIISNLFGKKQQMEKEKCMLLYPGSDSMSLNIIIMYRVTFYCLWNIVSFAQEQVDQTFIFVNLFHMY